MPPTSGAHWATAAQWSTYDSQQPFERTVHNLEHGGIVITYKGLTDQELVKLKEVVRVLMNSGYPKIVLEPYPTLTDGRIAVTAWRWLLKLQGFDDVPIVKFVKAHYDGPDAPEPGVR
jgi:hypothetical protein